MAAPSTLARGTPVGIPLRDGHSTLITLENDDTIEFWEKSVQPPGIDGGDPVDATTMHNTTWRVQRPRTLKTLTELSLTVAYDPQIYASGADGIQDQINSEQTITVTFPDASKVAFYGFVKSFTPTDNVEGEQPEAEIVIVPTNWDATNSVEAGPTVEETAGT